jgi:hypothetical protein
MNGLLDSTWLQALGVGRVRILRPARISRSEHGSADCHESAQCGQHMMIVGCCESPCSPKAGD